LLSQQQSCANLSVFFGFLKLNKYPKKERKDR